MSKFTKVRLKDCATFINGMAFKPIDWDTKGLPIVRIQNLTGTNKNFNYYSKEYNPKFEINNEDLLISWSASLGVFIWNGGKAILNQHIFKVVFDKIEISKKYFYFCILDILEEMSKKTHGSAMKHITKRNFDNIEIPLPPLQEQERIVGILDESFAKIDESIKILEQDLLNLDELIQSALQKAFNPLKDNAKENYKLPQGWEWKSLGEIANIKGGKRLPKGENLLDNSTKFAYIRVADFQDNGTINLQSVKFINENTYNILKNYKIYDDNLYISIAGTIGKSGIIPKELNGAILTENAIKLEYIQNNIINKFMYFFTLSSSFKTQIQISTKIVAQPKLAITRLKQIQIPLPPLKEQEQIASHLDELSSHVKNLKQNYQAQIKDLQELKKSLLDKAFKGNL